jgi:hypothetical protein
VKWEPSRALCGPSTLERKVGSERRCDRRNRSSCRLTQNGEAETLPQVKSALLTTTGLLLSTAVLATGCGGGSDTMRVTLTDDGCAYAGDTTPAPGLFDIDVENKTSHFANFTLSALPAGKTVEDVRHDGFRMRGAGGARTGPHKTSVMPVNVSSGRFVIGCWVHNSAVAAQSENPGPPAAFYLVPVELEVR